jgi:SAM-dependent methyltransferase
MRRIVSTEWLDQDAGSPREIARSLDDLWRINRWLGGVSGCLRLLLRALEARGLRSARILDVGAGDGRLAARLKSELARRNIHADFLALDRSASHLRQPVARDGVRPVAADALALPFRTGSFDLVMSNLLLHHFSDGRAESFLRSLAEAATIAVLVNDLERSALPYFFIRYALPFARSPITRHDGPASVRQAYTRDEMADLARRAGFENVSLQPAWPYRLNLILWK